MLPIAGVAEPHLAGGGIGARRRDGDCIDEAAGEQRPGAGAYCQCMVWSLPLRKAASRALEGLDLTSRVSLCSRAAQQFVQQMSLEHTVSAASPQSAGFLANLQLLSCADGQGCGCGNVRLTMRLVLVRLLFHQTLR